MTTPRGVLADGANDPTHREFAETLVDALTLSALPIIVYSAYEQISSGIGGGLSVPNAVIARLASSLLSARNGSDQT